MMKSIVDMVFEAKAAAFGMVNEESYFYLGQDYFSISFENGGSMEYYFNSGFLVFFGKECAPLWMANYSQRKELAEYKYKNGEKNDAKATFEKLKELALAS